MNNQPIRLNKFLAERLGLSRREADFAISKGRVTIDGKQASLGDRVDKTNKVCYNNKTIPFENKYIYILFHKPIGYVCSRKSQGNTPTLYTLLPDEYHSLKTVGRLDKDSSGLILLTNDGDFAFQMTHPKFRKIKVYEVELDKTLQPLHQQMISDYGVQLDDGISKFKIIKQSKDILLVFLTEGRNRQIRRTFAALGYQVMRLHRIQFGKYSLDDLNPGEYRIIKPVASLT